MLELPVKYCLSISIVMIAIMLSTIHLEVKGQNESVFNGLKGNKKRADRFFQQQDYKNALILYKSLLKKKKIDPDVFVKAAQASIKLEDPKNAILFLKNSQAKGNQLSNEELEILAESYTNLKKYDSAEIVYQRLNSKTKSNDYFNKIWQLRNLKFLFEDSIYYDIQRLKLNTVYGEFAPTIHSKGLYFMSNRPGTENIKLINQTTGLPFPKEYFQPIETDSINDIVIQKQLSIRPAFKSLHSKFGFGKVSFFENEQKIVFAKLIIDDKQALRSGLFFSNLVNDVWTEPIPYQYNRMGVHLMSPFMNKEGNTLFFAANFEDSFGGYDIYKSELKGDLWSEPVNMGNIINTKGDEKYPYFTNNALYFSSNGHSGIGGIDIFKVNFLGDKIYAPSNMGFPINSSFDDFGYEVVPNGTSAYLASNRKNGKLDDDIYKVTIDLQVYPLKLNVHLSVMENQAVDKKAKPSDLVNSKIELIEAVGGFLISETMSDDSGFCELEIPFSSRYKLRINNEKIKNYIAILDIPKNRKADKVHEIVIVKKAFNEL